MNQIDKEFSFISEHLNYFQHVLLGEFQCDKDAIMLIMWDIAR